MYGKCINERHKNKQKRNLSFAISNVIEMKGFVSEVVIIAITIASTIIVINAVNPIIEEGRTAQAISNAKQILKTVDTVVNQLVFEAPGAKRSRAIRRAQRKETYPDHRCR